MITPPKIKTPFSVRKGRNMIKLTCKNADSDTAIRFPSCPKANIVCSQQAFRLKSSWLNYGNDGCPGFSPEFPCLWQYSILYDYIICFYFFQ